MNRSSDIIHPAGRARKCHGPTHSLPRLLLPAILGLLLIVPATARKAWTTSIRVVPGRHQLIRPKPGEMVRIPAGWFIMGSDDHDVMFAVAMCNRVFGPTRLVGRFIGCGAHFFQDERPRRRVYLSTYTLDRNEVTRREYMECVMSRSCSLPPDPPSIGSFRRKDAPVVLVTWADAHSYCRFRRKRLPTEAEWEKAARGPFGRIWTWGSTWRSKVCNHGGLHPIHNLFDGDKSDGYYHVAPVGTFLAGRSFYGVEDMMGNVAEWVADRYSSSPHVTKSLLINPKGPLTGNHRVVKGGSWFSPTFMTRAASRLSYPPKQRQTFLGFRCAR